jgi:hypothetical protein
MNAIARLPQPAPVAPVDVNYAYDDGKFYVAVLDDAAPVSAPYARLSEVYTTLDDVIFAAQHYARENGLTIPFADEMRQHHADHLEWLEFEAELPW